MLDERWSEEANEIGDALAKMLAVEAGPEKIRAAEASADGADPSLEANLEAFGIFESGLDTEVLARIAMELGRALVPTSFVEAMPAQMVLGLSGVAYGFEGPVPASFAQVAVERGGAVFVEQLTGSARRTAAGDFLVTHMGASSAECVGDAADADRMRRLAGLLGAARLVGAGQALLKYGAAYAREREQFGKVIGSYQGVAHRLTDAAILLDSADLLVRKAAFTALPEAGGDRAPTKIFAVMVRAKAVDAARAAASTVHQTFGGNGFAMEYDVQLYSRRIRNWAMRLDRPGPQLADLGRMLLDPVQRDAIRHLWHNDQGVPIPRWAQEADKMSR